MAKGVWAKMSEGTEEKRLSLHYRTKKDAKILKELLSRNSLKYDDFPNENILNIFPGYGDAKWFLTDIKERFKLRFSFYGEK